MEESIWTMPRRRGWMCPGRTKSRAWEGKSVLPAPFRQPRGGDGLAQCSEPWAASTRSSQPTNLGLPLSRCLKPPPRRRWAFSRRSHSHHRIGVVDCRAAVQCCNVAAGKWDVAKPGSAVGGWAVDGGNHVGTAAILLNAVPLNAGSRGSPTPK